MNFKTPIVLFVASISFTTFYAYPATPRQKMIDEHAPNHKPIYFGDGTEQDSEEHQFLIKQFYENQFRQFSDPLAPYFMLMSRDGNLALGVGGVFALREYYDWHGTQNGTDFIPYDIDTSVSPISRHGFGTSVAGTKLFATVLGRTNRLGYYKVYIEGKFNAGKNFVLTKAYGTLADWTLGYASSTFSDGASQPSTVDSQGPNSIISKTNVLVRWMHTFNKHYVVAASVETPSSMIPTSEFYTGCTDYIPSLAAFAQYQWEGTHQHIRLSGIVRGLEYRDLVTDTNHKKVGWGLHMSTVFSPFPTATVFGGIQGGKGISDMVNDLQLAPLDMAPYYSNTGRLYTTAELGWFAALQYSWTPNIYSTVIFSQQRYMPSHQPRLDNDTYRCGYYATANIFYHPIPRATIGVEYNYGYRQNYDRLSGHQNRVQVMFEFDF